jgi:large subunit ribosomal protein L47
MFSMACRNNTQLLARRGIGLFTTTTTATIAATTTRHAVAAIASTNNNVQHDLYNNRRSYSSTIVANKEYAPNPLDAFRDPIDRQIRGQEIVGRQWSVTELRRKSYEDLHRLWYVLYKEKNMLLTEQQLSRRRQLIFPQPERFKKVQKSMGSIRQVLGERKRETVAAHLARHEEKLQTKELELAARMMDEVGINSNNNDQESFEGSDGDEKK